MHDDDRLWTFFGSVLAASAAISGLAWITGNHGLAILAVFTPSSAALVLARRSGPGPASLWGAAASLGWKLGGVLIFPVLAMAAALIWTVGGEDILARSDVGEPLMVLVLASLIALGEEFGWRGFAMPRLLQRTDPWRATLVLGLVWWLWHVPATVLLGVGTPVGIPILAFAPFVLGATALFTAVHLRTAATSVAIALHMGANLANGLTPVLPESIGGTAGVFWLFTGLVGLTGLGALHLEHRRRSQGADASAPQVR